MQNVFQENMLHTKKVFLNQSQHLPRHNPLYCKSQIDNLRLTGCPLSFYFVAVSWICSLILQITNLRDLIPTLKFHPRDNYLHAAITLIVTTGSSPVKHPDAVVLLKTVIEFAKSRNEVNQQDVDGNTALHWIALCKGSFFFFFLFHTCESYLYVDQFCAKTFSHLPLFLILPPFLLHHDLCLLFSAIINPSSHLSQIQLLKLLKLCLSTFFHLCFASENYRVPVSR